MNSKIPVVMKRDKKLKLFFNIYNVGSNNPTMKELDTIVINDYNDNNNDESDSEDIDVDESIDELNEEIDTNEANEMNETINDLEEEEYSNSKLSDDHSGDSGRNSNEIDSDGETVYYENRDSIVFASDLDFSNEESIANLVNEHLKNAWKKEIVRAPTAAQLSQIISGNISNNELVNPLSLNGTDLKSFSRQILSQFLDPFSRGSRCVRWLDPTLATHLRGLLLLSFASQPTDSSCGIYLSGSTLSQNMMRLLVLSLARSTSADYINLSSSSRRKVSSVVVQSLLSSLSSHPLMTSEISQQIQRLAEDNRRITKALLDVIEENGSKQRRMVLHACEDLSVGFGRVPDAKLKLSKNVKEGHLFVVKSDPVSILRPGFSPADITKDDFNDSSLDSAISFPPTSNSMEGSEVRPNDSMDNIFNKINNNNFRVPSEMDSFSGSDSSLPLMPFPSIPQILSQIPPQIVSQFAHLLGFAQTFSIVLSNGNISIDVCSPSHQSSSSIPFPSNSIPPSSSSPNQMFSQPSVPVPIPLSTLQLPDSLIKHLKQHIAQSGRPLTSSEFREFLKDPAVAGDVRLFLNRLASAVLTQLPPAHRKLILTQRTEKHGEKHGNKHDNDNENGISLGNSPPAAGLEVRMSVLVDPPSDPRQLAQLALTALTRVLASSQKPEKKAEKDEEKEVEKGVKDEVFSLSLAELAKTDGSIFSDDTKTKRISRFPVGDFFKRRFGPTPKAADASSNISKSSKSGISDSLPSLSSNSSISPESQVELDPEEAARRCFEEVLVLERGLTHFHISPPRAPALRRVWLAIARAEAEERVRTSNARALSRELRTQGLSLSSKSGDSSSSASPIAFSSPSLARLMANRALGKGDARAVILCARTMQAGVQPLPGISLNSNSTNSVLPAFSASSASVSSDSSVVSAWALEAGLSRLLGLPVPRLVPPASAAALAFARVTAAAHSQDGKDSQYSLDKHERALLKCAVRPGLLRARLEDVGGLDPAKRALRRAVTLPLTHAHLYPRGLARETAKGVLLFGPPGTGKTMLARAIAAEGDCNFLAIDPAALEDKWLGESEKNARAVFSLARKLSPCVVFIDEIDAVLSSREDGEGHASLTSVKTTLLQEWDGLLSGDREVESEVENEAEVAESGVENEAVVVVVAATNRPWALDEACLRRLPARVLVDLPCARAREAVLRASLRGQRLAADVDLARVAGKMAGYTGSDVREVAREAVAGVSHEAAESEDAGEQGAVLREVCARDLERALSGVRASVDATSAASRRLAEWNKRYGGLREVKGKRTRAIDNLYL